MKILLLGAAGQLAHDLTLQLSEHELTGWTRQDLDITNSEAVEQRLADLRPQLVINTAAYNLVDQAEAEPLAAFTHNCLGPRNLALTCGKLQIELLHFSTDYVFGQETSDRPWKENDAPGPVSVYGISKLAGEHAVAAYCHQHYIVRTCGLYGVKGSRGKGGNFIETMLRLAGEGKPLRVVDDQLCTPSFTADIARATAKLIDSHRYGRYHVTNSGQCTWYQLACEVFRQAGLTVDCQPIRSQDFNAPARRPAYSVLDNTKLQQTCGIILPEWQDAVSRYLAARK